MKDIDDSIKNVSKVISKNIISLENDRGLLSQNLLSQFRNLVEYAIQKVYSVSQKIDINAHDYKDKKAAISWIASKGNYRFIFEFHCLLQKSASHYTESGDGSERLMLKYYSYLVRLRNLLKKEYSLNVLDNLEDFPLDIDESLSRYYENVVNAIFKHSNFIDYDNYNDRYYILSKKPFFVDKNVYYEISIIPANLKSSKFDRKIVFSKYDIPTNYAVKLTIINTNINDFGTKIPIKIIDKWNISIRPCELNNFAKIFSIDLKIRTDSIEYKKIMQFLTNTKMPFNEIILNRKNYYNFIKSISKDKEPKVKIMFDSCRDIIINNRRASNILSYLLFNLQNTIIRKQYSFNICNNLSNLKLNYGCIPFDVMPYSTALCGHNPKIIDLLNCIDPKFHEPEILARKIRNNSEINGELFTSIKDLNIFGNKDKIDNLIEKYNSNLYSKHRNSRKIVNKKGNMYINRYIENIHEIIIFLKEMSTCGVKDYFNYANNVLLKKEINIDDRNKKSALLSMFSDSHVFFIYGAAGTGKSTMISQISLLLYESKRLYLANTNSAVNNLKNRVSENNSDFSTIRSFLSKKDDCIDYDIIFIDECSTVSNDDMVKISRKLKRNNENDNFLLVLVGDVYQIESIRFGNWFSIAKRFLPDSTNIELEKTFRTDSNDLLLIWDRVRKFDNSIVESLVSADCSQTLDKTIFEALHKDEVVLCLNYDGVYGINNINKILQSNNHNKEYIWGTNTYKVDDPIIFNESNRFYPLIYNNVKGIIKDIKLEGSKIIFRVLVNLSIMETAANSYDFDLISVDDSGNSIIEFEVLPPISSDQDDDEENNMSSVIPFQVSYAVSIHKAQGLEYDSVKIVITEEASDEITHNIFYTAITRAKKSLKIYWSPESEQYIISNFKKHSNKKNIDILKSIYPDL